MSEISLPSNRIGALYDKTLGKIIPRINFFAMLFLPIFDTFMYVIADKLADDASRGTLSLPFDTMIPLVEEWVLVYFGCYIFWFAGLFHMTTKDKERFFGFFARALVSLIVIFSCFILLPLEIARPEITGEGFFAEAMRFLYRIDLPYNLFPSLHCFFNWFIYIQLRGRKEYPLALRLFSCLFSFAVFASTLFTRQHYILDVVAGVFVAEASALVLKTPLPRLCMKLFASIDRLLFTKSAPSDAE